MQKKTLHPLLAEELQRRGREWGTKNAQALKLSADRDEKYHGQWPVDAVRPEPPEPYVGRLTRGSVAQAD